MSFLNARRRMTNVEAFIKETAEASRDVKYSSAANAKHRIFFPTVPSTDIVDGKEVQTKGLKAFTIDIHNVRAVDGKYKGTYCTRNTTDGNGKEVSCPYCENVSKAWDIVNYRIEREKETCGLTGAALDKHMDEKRKAFIKELKLQRPSTNAYVLVAQYKLNAQNKPTIDADTKLPVYDLKVMRMSINRLSTLEEIAKDLGYEGLDGVEFIFTYDGAEPQYRKSTDTGISAESRYVAKYPGLEEAITKAAEEFDMDKISSAFAELREVPVEEKQKIVNDLFASWDSYLIEKQANPDAVYLEGKTAAPVPTASEAKPLPDMGVSADALFSDNGIGNIDL